MTIQEHFARVEPIVGVQLRRAYVALCGLPAAAPIVAYLAACGVGRWLWARDGQPATSDEQSTFGVMGGCADAGSLQAYLRAQHGAALALDVAVLPLDAWAIALRREPPDLVIAMGDAESQRLALAAAMAAHVPALLITSEIANWNWITAAPLCAGLARAILLRDTPERRADLAELWAAGMRVCTIGAQAAPFAITWSEPSPTTRLRVPVSPCLSHFHTPIAKRGTLLIAGLGSLGSVAAALLVDHAASLVIADPDRVDVYNPARQAYPLAAIGRPKAQALREQLARSGANRVVALDDALDDEREVAALVEQYGITAALIVTGTAADFAIARALRELDIPHVVGRCYPRARYWEAIVVDGRRGPSLSDLRGHVRVGPAPAPTPEQIAAYSDAGALEAEPATLIESGWAAAWLARLAAQLLAPPGLRERWLLELLESEQTCLIGGVGVERTAEGPAYGVELPGAVRACGGALPHFLAGMGE